MMGSALFMGLTSHCTSLAKCPSPLPIFYRIVGEFIMYFGCGSNSRYTCRKTFWCFVFLATAFWGIKALSFDLSNVSLLSSVASTFFVISVSPKVTKVFFMFPSGSVTVSVHTFKWITHLDRVNLCIGYEGWGLFLFIWSLQFLGSFIEKTHLS